jgi:arginyl-tRNA synthetase
VITRDLRHALRRALATPGFPADADPGLRPTGMPGGYAASVALTLGADPRATAATLAANLAGEPWIATAEVTGPGYLTVTVTPQALAAVAENVTAEGPACVTSDALTGVTVPAVPPGDPLTAPTWAAARAALAARLTARLAAAAGATVSEWAAPERNRLTHPAHPFPAKAPLTSPASRRPTSSDPEAGVSRTRSEADNAGPDTEAGPPNTAAASDAKMPPPETGVAATVAFAGRDAVLFTLARAVPGKPLRADPEIMARHVPGNPAYAVRYAHARAASGVRWAAASSAADTIGSREAQGEAALLDALSWLPERVAAAARRGRPDEFARYLEDLASVTVDVLSSASHPGSAAAPGSDRLTLAMAARTGLAAGLGLLEVTAPERL